LARRKFIPCASIDKIKGSIDIAGKDNNQLKIKGWVLVKSFNNKLYLRSAFDFNIELNSIGFVSDSEIHVVQVYGLSSGRYFLLKSFF
jgi:hypothetical protein